MLQLLSDERRELLDLARRSLIEAVQHGHSPAVPLASGALAEPAGVFVTLRHRGRLRGCIGRVERLEPLAHAVAKCAGAAALEDPRFDRVRIEEVPEVEIEISLLSAMQRARPEQIEAGRHGVMITRGYRRGLLLPQVARQFGWSAERFLEETCVKGGLERDAWKDEGTCIEVFTAEIFSESDFREEPKARAG